MPFSYAAARLLVALDRELVHLLAREVVHLGHVLGGLRHRRDRWGVQNEVREWDGEVVAVVRRHVALHVVRLRQALVELRDARLRPAVSAAAERAAHTLDSERDPALRGPDHDRLGDAVQRLHARAALTVRIERTDLQWQTGQPCHAVRANQDQFPGTAHVSEADVLDQPRVDLRVALHQAAHDLRARFVQTRGDEASPPAATERGADAIDQHDVIELHSDSSWCESRPVRRPIRRGSIAHASGTGHERECDAGATFRRRGVSHRASEPV